MKLRGIQFGSVHGASGVQGFFGEGYRIHKLWKLAFPGMFSFKGMTFTAKTTTLHKNIGHMPLGPDGITPLELKPKCVFVDARSWWKEVALNSVALSGPGARPLFETHRWQERIDAFFISFMPIEKERKGRMLEMEQFVAIFKEYLHQFSGKVGLQINKSCPNVGLHVAGDSHAAEFVSECRETLDIASSLGIPVAMKFNLLLSPEVVGEISSHESCDAVCMSNTLPWGTLPHRIDWKGLFGTTESPLKHLGGGGLSGAPLFPLLFEWLKAAKGIVNEPIIAGGGIMSAADVRKLSLYVQPQAVSLGTIAMLRPWRLAHTIRRANALL